MNGYRGVVSNSKKYKNMKIKQSEILREILEESKMSRQGFADLLWSIYRLAVDTQLFNERESKIYEMIINGATLNEVGKHFNLTKERIRQIYNRSLRKAHAMLYRLNKEREELTEYRNQIAKLTAENKVLKDINQKLAEENGKKDDVVVEFDATPLTDFDFTTRALNCFNAADIKTVGELRMFSPSDLLKFRNFGRKSIEEVRSFFEKYYNEKW